MSHNVADPVKKNMIYIQFWLIAFPLFHQKMCWLFVEI